MLGLSLGVVGATSTDGLVYGSAETLTFVSAMGTRPTQSDVTLINTCITSLVSGGVWAKLDVLHINALHTEQASLLQWKQTGANMTPVNTPTFTTYRGHAGNGTTSYVDTGYNPSTFPGAQYTQNDSMVWVYTTTNAASSTRSFGATNGSNGTDLIVRGGTGVMNGRMNNASRASTVATSASSINSFAIDRSSSLNYNLYRGGSLLETRVITSNAIPNVNFFLCGNNNAGTLEAPSTTRISAFAAGKSLSAEEHATLHSAVNTFLTAVGAV